MERIPNSIHYKKHPLVGQPLPQLLSAAAAAGDSPDAAIPIQLLKWKLKVSS
ncbi:MAG: hypothetical protein ACRD8W_09955 [Nitrososphaeraceae archaeon]